MNLVSRCATVAMLGIWSTISVTAQPLKVGTFDKVAVTIAFYRSSVWADVLKQKQMELEAARKAGDAQKVGELERWGGSSQALAHKQLMGEAGIANILEVLRPALPEIAAKAQVVMILADVPYADKTVQTVDVTEFFLDWLKADAQTRKVIADMPKAKAQELR